MMCSKDAKVKQPIDFFFFFFFFLTFWPVCIGRHYLPFDVVQGRPVSGVGRGFIAVGL